MISIIRPPAVLTGAIFIIIATAIATSTIIVIYFNKRRLPVVVHAIAGYGNHLIIQQALFAISLFGRATPEGSSQWLPDVVAATAGAT